MKRQELRIPGGDWPYTRISPGGLARDLEGAVNAYRGSRGLVALREDGGLATACRLHAERMIGARFFAHVDPSTGSGPLDRVQSVDDRGWRMVAENLAAGHWTSQQILDGWVSSPEHRANLELPNAVLFGTAVVLGGEFHTYIVQLYGASNRDPGPKPKTKGRLRSGYYYGK